MYDTRVPLGERGVWGRYILQCLVVNRSRRWQMADGMAPDDAKVTFLYGLGSNSSRLPPFMFQFFASTMLGFSVVVVSYTTCRVFRGQVAFLPGRSSPLDCSRLLHACIDDKRAAGSCFLEWKSHLEKEEDNTTLDMNKTSLSPTACFV